ncbi:hypothetical protein KIN20_012020 [Parelaphostrongylus tenuis]|uniref:Uncharacterized protein n=1 Tax=Parelaphostrongylus tenuis TaxID=148309 RepID=A0AAD5QQ92_PARTN|nr:hypothetical protein KIN20_012020 [Parelaphostrongylus tenuis]
MVYTTPMVSAQVFGIATSKEGAQALVQHLVTQAVTTQPTFFMYSIFDALEMQGRSAFLSDAVISGILSQLTVNIVYEPL